MILAFSIKNIYFIPFISAKFIKLFYAFWRCYTKTAEAPVERSPLFIILLQSIGLSKRSLCCT